MSAEQLSREEVVALLDGEPGTPEGLDALTGGAWSSASAYRADGEELVVRFGRKVSWYEADRMAMAFGGSDLPVPEIGEVGTTPSGRAHAISVRHHGRFLEDTPVEQAGAITPTRLLVALYRVPADPDAPVVWHHAGASAGSWQEFLLASLVDDPGKLVHGWSATLAGDQELAALSAAVTERVRTTDRFQPYGQDSPTLETRSTSAASGSSWPSTLDVALKLATEGSKACNRKVEVRRNAAKAAGRAHSRRRCPAMASMSRIANNPAYQKVLERHPGGGVGSGQRSS